MAEDRLEGKDLQVMLGWVLAGVVGAVLAFQYFFVAFPEAAVDFRISRDEAQQRAREFLEKQGHKLSGYQSSIVFGQDGNAKTYLEREMGLEQANRLMAAEVNVWYWNVRFFRPKQKEEFRVEADPGGRIVGMTHVVEEAREGARLEQEAARALAEEFLGARLRMNLEAWEFLAAESNSTERPKRRDWSFTWERRGFKAKDAPYRVKVEVQGDAAGEYSEFLKVPEAWERDFQRLRSSNELYQWLGQVPGFFLQGAVFVVLFELGKRGLVQWKGGLKLGLVLAALFFVLQANSWPLERAAYDTNSDYSAFVVKTFFLAAVGSLLLGMIVAFTLVAAEPLYRRDHPEKLSLAASCTLPGLRSKEFFRATLIGLGMAAAHIGFVVMFYVVGKQFGFWTPQDIKYSDAVSTALPWIYPLAISLYAATSEEFLFRLFAIPVLLRMTRSKLVAIVLPAFIWGFLHSAYPVQPGYARGLEVGIIGVVAGWVMLRWGILATLVWHYTVDALLISLFLLRSENLYFRLSGAVVAGAVLLPFAFAGVSYLVRRRFEAEEALLNRARPVEAAAEAAPAAAPVVAREYEGLSARALGTALLLGALGVVLAVMVEPKSLGSFVRFSRTGRQAAHQADQVLRQRKVDPGRYRHVATFVPTFDPYAGEYLRRQAGLDGANRLYREKVPAAFWRVRYFRDSEKEEYHVVLRTDGTLHSVRHLLDEKAPGASLSKEEAQARAEAFLRDEKKLDLAKWKLVEARSDKQPARTDHTLVWEELEGVGEAHVRVEVSVLGDEIAGNRIFVKIPEEWERKQKETTLVDTGFLGLRLLLILAFGVTVLVIFFRNLRQQRVPWRRMALWGAWGGLAMLIFLTNSWLLNTALYQTEMPLRTFTAILLMGQIIVVFTIYSGIFFLFGLGWFFLSRAFGEARMPSWRGMPAAYYRDAFVLALAGAGALAGLSRVRVLAERFFPTEKESLGAALPTGLDTILPGVAFVSSAVMAALFMAGLFGLVAGFLAGYVRARWMQAAALLLAAVSMAGSPSGPADFFKSLLLSLLTLGVLVFGAARLLRFNLLAYFLAAVTVTLAGGAAQLLRQPADFYKMNGYFVLGALALLLAWPLVAWRKALSAPAVPASGIPAAPLGETPAGPPGEA